MQRKNKFTKDDWRSQLQKFDKIDEEHKGKEVANDNFKGPESIFFLEKKNI